MCIRDRQDGDDYFRFNVASGTYSSGIQTGTTNESVTEIVERYVESHDLAGPHPPQFLDIGRKFLRRNSAYTLNLADLVTGELTIQASGLPAGLSIANNIISGTPTTEQVVFSTITATNEDGNSSILIPFIVLRDISFQTSQRGSTGITTRGSEVVIVVPGTAQLLSLIHI